MVMVPVTAAAPRALACVRRREAALGWVVASPARTTEQRCFRD
jgi:hypothetical protein